MVPSQISMAQSSHRRVNGLDRAVLIPSGSSSIRGMVAYPPSMARRSQMIALSFDSMRTIAIIYAALATCCAACTEQNNIDPKTVSCFSLCNSNIECAASTDRRCGICSFGHCSSVSPLDPVDQDAGIDSAADVP